MRIGSTERQVAGKQKPISNAWILEQNVNEQRRVGQGENAETTKWSTLFLEQLIEDWKDIAEKHRHVSTYDGLEAEWAHQKADETKGQYCWPSVEAL